MAKNVKAGARGKRKARKNIARGVAHVTQHLTIPSLLLLMKTEML